ncbi:MAG TPA: restriction endonuclease subunit S [Bacteroidales bacterium]|nr:restriction endonuclease subunit S [Bacteroidales bacterium]
MKWEKIAFSELVEFSPRVTLEKGELYDNIPMDVVDGGIKYVQEINQRLYTGGGAKFGNGDTIFARITPCLENGKIAKVKDLEKGVGFGSTEFFVFRAKENISDPDFIYYLSKTDIVRQPAIKSMVGASGRQRADKGVVEQIKVPDIPLPTQRRIATILSAYDDLIENNLKRITLLEEKAFASYKLIVKSEKLIGGKVGDLADVKSGYAFKSRDWTEEGLPVIKIKNIGNNDIDITDCSFIPENIAEAANKFKLNSGDLLIAMTGATVGKIGMMPRTEISFYLNQRVGIFKPKVKNAELFLFCFFNEPTAKNAVESLASGAAQPNISSGQLESIKLFYPRLETLEEFGNSIKSDFELILNLKQQNTRLREARDILLPKLMNGQIEV